MAQSFGPPPRWLIEALGDAELEPAELRYLLEIKCPPSRIFVSALRLFVRRWYCTHEDLKSVLPLLADTVYEAGTPANLRVLLAVCVTSPAICWPPIPVLGNRIVSVTAAISRASEHIVSSANASRKLPSAIAEEALEQLNAHRTRRPTKLV